MLLLRLDGEEEKGEDGEDVVEGPGQREEVAGGWDLLVPLDSIL